MCFFLKEKNIKSTKTFKFRGPCQGGVVPAFFTPEGDEAGAEQWEGSTRRTD